MIGKFIQRFFESARYAACPTIVEWCGGFLLVGFDDLFGLSVKIRDFVRQIGHQLWGQAAGSAQGIEELILCETPHDNSPLNRLAIATEA